MSTILTPTTADTKMVPWSNGNMVYLEDVAAIEAQAEQTVQTELADWSKGIKRVDATALLSWVDTQLT